MLKQDQLDEIERIERRNAKIKQLLADGDAKSLDAPKTAEPREASAAAVAVGKEVSVVEGSSRPQGADEISVAYGRKPKPWQDARGRQVRPQTQAEIQIEQDRAFLKSQWDADQEHAAKVKAAEREQAKEIADNKKRREHEAKTNRRPYNEGRFISLAEAARRGLIGQGSGSDNNGRPEWWSESNPEGRMCGG